MAQQLNGGCAARWTGKRKAFTGRFGGRSKLNSGCAARLIREG